jgi:hypothetical protein
MIFSKIKSYRKFIFNKLIKINKQVTILFEFKLIPEDIDAVVRDMVSLHIEPLLTRPLMQHKNVVS